MRSNVRSAINPTFQVIVTLLGLSSSGTDSYWWPFGTSSYWAGFIAPAKIPHLLCSATGALRKNL